MGGQRRWDKGQMLYYTADRAVAFYKITKGVVVELIGLPDGRRQIVAIRAAGDLCGYPTRNGRYVLTGQAITPVEACAFYAEEFSAYMAQSVAFASAVAEDLAERLIQATVSQTVVGRLNSVEQVAHFILEMQALGRSSGSYARLVALHLTRQEIADYLGITLETASRAFSKLKCMGLISMCSANVVAVMDQQRLAELGVGALVQQRAEPALKGSAGAKFVHWP